MDNRNAYRREIAMTYFDNAATTFPKPGRVRRAVQSAMETYGANPGRSGHKLAMRTAVKIYECREAAAQLFGAQVEEVVFCSNCSHALNIAIKGCLHMGDHVIISDLEHNSVLRPVHGLAARGLITYSVAATRPGDDEGTVEAFEQLITPNTRLIACTHASNAFGLRLPIEKIGALCRRNDILFLVDAAQTAGVLDIDMERCGIDFLCMAGHKSLYGPSGTGLLVTARGDELATLMEGGTGSASAELEMPASMPDRLECGTVNTAGVIGLGAGLAFLRERGIANIHRQEMLLGKAIHDRLRRIPGVLLYTPDFTPEENLPVIPFNIEGIPSEQVTDQLSERGFALRGGLHCAPLAHRKMGTLETGTARISIGVMNTLEEGRALCTAIQKIAAGH